MCRPERALSQREWRCRLVEEITGRPRVDAAGLKIALARASQHFHVPTTQETKVTTVFSKRNKIWATVVLALVAWLRRLQKIRFRRGTVNAARGSGGRG
jgi:hypothetical protein